MTASGNTPFTFHFPRASGFYSVGVPVQRPTSCYLHVLCGLFVLCLILSPCVFSCLVFFCFVFSDLVVLCLVFSCLVVFCFVFTCLSLVFFIVLPCFVSSCLILSSLVFSCLVLSCLVLLCFVLFCLLSFRLVFVLSRLVLSGFVFSYFILLCLVLSFHSVPPDLTCCLSLQGPIAHHHQCPRRLHWCRYRRAPVSSRVAG